MLPVFPMFLMMLASFLMLAVFVMFLMPLDFVAVLRGCGMSLGCQRAENKSEQRKEKNDLFHNTAPIWTNAQAVRVTSIFTTINTIAFHETNGLSRLL